jgi:hypothetical protein
MIPGWAQLLDRIAVTVGKTVITEGEVLTNLRVAAFLDQKEPDLSGPSKKKAAERLVDQVLLRREVPLSGVVQDTSVVIADLKKRYSSAVTQAPARPLTDQEQLAPASVASRSSGEAEYKAALEHYQITEQDVIDQLLNGLESLEASNRRFRVEVQVSEDEVKSRYDAFAKDLKERNVPTIPGLEESHKRVQELLTDQKVSDALEKWLEITREQSSIVYREAVFK